MYQTGWLLSLGSSNQSDLFSVSREKKRTPTRTKIGKIVFSPSWASQPTKTPNQTERLMKSWEEGGSDM